MKMKNQWDFRKAVLVEQITLVDKFLKIKNVLKTCNFDLSQFLSEADFFG